MYTIARTANEKYRKAKENKIIENARQVFCRKGYLGVTMQDIVEECGISRGGIYLYFASVDEIFQAVVASRDKAKFSVVRKSVEDDEAFAKVLDDFMALQRERLLRIENSLLRATYEYVFSGAEGATAAFRNAQLDNLRRSVLAILMLGIKQGVLQDEGMNALVDHFIIVIEGLSVLYLTEILTEKIVDEQFAILNSMLDNIRV